MRIGIDLHGVIDDDVEFFSNLMGTWKIDGNVVYIISGPLGLEIIDETTKLGLIPNIHYDRVLSVVGYLKAKNVKMWLDHKNTWWANEKEWWASKAAICRENNIDLMIDNDERYREYFTDRTKFLLYKTRNKKTK